MLKKAALCMVLSLPWALQAGNAVCETLLTLMAILAIVLHRDILTDRSIFKNHTFLLLLLAYLIINAAIIAPSVRSIASSIGMIRIPLGIVLVSQTLKRHPQALLFFSYSCVGSLLWMFTNTLLQMILGYDAFGNKLMEYGSFLRLVTTSGKPRIGGCAVVLSILSMAFAIQSMKRQLWNRTLLYASAVLCGMVVVVLSGERTALLLLACSIALYLLLEKSIPLGIKFLLSGAFISSMVVIFLLLEQSVYYRMVEMMLYQIHNFKTDAYGRIYCTAWQMWLANPWFGIGSNAFFHECTMFLQERMNESLRCGAHPHNIYLQLMVENGMVGFMLFIGIIIRWYRNLKLTTGDSIATLSICLMSSRLLPFLPANNIYHAYSLLPIIMILGLSRNIRS